jgi:hypothetical protein
MTSKGSSEIPSIDVGEADPIEQPPAPQPAQADGGTPAPATTDDCGQPQLMDKVVAGGFLGGVTMDDYYPDLAGKGYWQHAGSGGTFDTGKRVGGIAQLYSVIPSPCDPAQYRLAQSVTRTRDRINGVTDPTDGQTLDDIKKSGRNASQAPFRQGFVGGGGAPLGYIISMADPPSIGYGPSTNAERDRDFTTSLIGPSGQQSVSWLLSIRVVNGVVTRNSLS